MEKINRKKIFADICAQLIAVRQEKYFCQEEAARATGLSLKTIFLTESGHRLSALPLGELINYAAVFNKKLEIRLTPL